MKSLREIVVGFVSSLVTALIVFGAFSLSLTEGIPTIPHSQQPTKTAPALIPFPTGLQVISLQSPTPIPTTEFTEVSFIPTGCVLPAGWTTYTIQSGDTINSLANRFGVNPEGMREANCLLTDTLIPGTLLSVPPLSPTSTKEVMPTPVVIQCGPPAGWISYLVQPGETLFSISLRYGISVPQLQSANCLANATYIRYGEILYVPNVPTRPVPRLNTAIPSTTPTPMPSATQPIRTVPTVDLSATNTSLTATRQAELNASQTAAALTASAEANLYASQTAAAVAATEQFYASQTAAAIAATEQFYASQTAAAVAATEQFYASQTAAALTAAANQQNAPQPNP
jgi:LysM repeat protein